MPHDQENALQCRYAGIDAMLKATNEGLLVHPERKSKQTYSPGISESGPILVESTLSEFRRQALACCGWILPPNTVFAEIER